MWLCDASCSCAVTKRTPLMSTGKFVVVQRASDVSIHVLGAPSASCCGLNATMIAVRPVCSAGRSPQTCVHYTLQDTLPRQHVWRKECSEPTMQPHAMTDGLCKQARLLESVQLKAVKTVLQYILQ